VISKLRHIFDTNSVLRQRMEARLKANQTLNPDRVTNPVQSMEELYEWLQHFLTCLPWDGLNLPNRSVFRRIDQSIGYAYYLFGDLQYEQEIAQWLIAYNQAWGEWLHSPDSWNNACYELAKTDARFELTTGKYEPSCNWHCWNDFFCRRLAEGNTFVGQTLADGLIAPSEGDLNDGPVKTMNHYAWADLLGDSPYREQLMDKKAVHLSLDMYHYHRLHAPCDGRIVDMRIIPGLHLDGGEIIWDANQNRYRYAKTNNTDFQSLETRGVAVLDRSGLGLVAVVAVGVAQISSVNWIEGLKTGDEIRQGQEIGYFACGGSDVVVVY